MNLICLIDSIIYLVIVAFLWGITNPFIKKGSQGLENVKSSSRLGQFFKELSFLLTTFRVFFKIVTFLKCLKLMQVY